MTLEELRKLEERATPAPWWSETAIVEVESCISASRVEAGLSPNVEELMIDIESGQVTIANCYSGLVDRGRPEVEANAALIAALRNKARALIKVAEAAKAILPFVPDLPDNYKWEHPAAARKLRDALSELESP